MPLHLRMPAVHQNRLLVTIVFAQFAGTSLWFAGNAIIDKINPHINHATITSLVQIGFISGTLLFSLLNIADRFRAAHVFFISSCLAAGANLLIVWAGSDSFLVLTLRFITGFFLAGIYPVGMKIAADFFPQKLGQALGFLVGALVLGTAFPHLVRSQLGNLNAVVVLSVTSALAVLGGVLIFFLVPAKDSLTGVTKPDFLAALKLFRSRPFRSAAFGYFGHMWELYALWSVLPLVFGHRNLLFAEGANVFWWSFWVIAAGSLGCVVGGLISRRTGSKPVAFYSLVLSGSFCLLSGFLFSSSSGIFYLLYLLWGLTVTADSPQFSALVASAAVAKYKGTALTIVTSIGFAITIASIELLNSAFSLYHEKALWLLLPGPIFGLLALRRPKG